MKRITWRLLCALVMFVTLAVGSSCTDGDSMRRQLQALQALNQADSLMTDLPQATALCRYFDRHGTPNERMLAHYLLGRTYGDLGEAPQALEEYHAAAECADTTAKDCDFHRLSVLYGQMGELFFQQHIPQKASECYQQACYFARKDNDKFMEIICIEQQGKCLYHQNNKEEACKLLEKVKLMYLSIGDTLSANTCIGPASYLYSHSGELEKARVALRDYEFNSHLNSNEIASNPRWQMLYIYKGEYFLAAQHLDSALFYFCKELECAKEVNNRLLAYSGLHRTYYRLGDMDSVAKYARLQAEYSDSNVNHSASDMLQVLQENYDYHRHQLKAQQKEYESLKLRKNLQVVGLISILLLLICITIIVIIRRHSKMAIMRINSKYTTDLLRYSSLKNEMIKLRQQNQEESDKAKKAQQELISLQESLRKLQSDGMPPQEWTIADDVLQESIVVKFHQMAAVGRSATSDEWIEMRKVVNRYMPSFLETISNLNYHANLIETEICILVRLRFLMSEICSITKLKPSALANKRQRLLKKMFNVDGRASDFDERIQTLIVS